MAKPPQGHSRLAVERELVLRRCEQDAEYFIANYVKVLEVGRGYQKFDCGRISPKLWVGCSRNMATSRHGTWR